MYTFTITRSDNTLFTFTMTNLDLEDVGRLVAVFSQTPGLRSVRVTPA